MTVRFSVLHQVTDSPPPSDPGRPSATTAEKTGGGLLPLCGPPPDT
ncbi:hypothetical protein [Streptomyces atriruber]|nr:hypothetical protein [Streptomyces atriruber]